MKPVPRHILMLFVAAGAEVLNLDAAYDIARGHGSSFLLFASCLAAAAMLHSIYFHARILLALWSAKP